MADYRLGVVEQQFAKLIWQNEPISSGELVKLCDEKLKWKKSTTYTVLKRLCEKGVFENQNGMVISKESEEAFYAQQSEAVVNETFGGSLPAFVAAFAQQKSLTGKEVEEIRQIIDSFKGEEK